MAERFGFPLTNRQKDQPKLSTGVAAVRGQLRNPGLVYTNNIGKRVSSLEFEASEWDLAKCGRIFDTESIFRRAVRTKQDLFLKEGYEFNGPNIERSRYIATRLYQIEVASGTPLLMLFSETVSSLKRCSNAYWVKVRDYKASGGKRRFIGKREVDPVAAYFVLPAESIKIKKDETGKIVKYRQEVYGKEPKDFDPKDIIHWYSDKRAGFSVGVPEVVPVEDDIRALRRIEENLELLIYQHLFPLFHYKVGTEDKPAVINPDGTDEVVEMQMKVAELPSDGCWVTSERHDIKAITAGTPPVAVDKVIEHYKHRIYIGLGVSPIDMGEGGSASRSTAHTLSRNLINSTKAYQKEFGAQFYHNVISELLLESTFDVETLFDEENKVFLRFKEIDQETRLAKDNHLADLFLKNLITLDEVRIDMGRQPLQGEGWPTSSSKKQMFVKGDGDFAKTNYGLFDRDKVILQSLDEPGTPESKLEVKSRASANSSKENGSIANKNKPENQHGTRPAAKLNKDSFIHRPHLSSLRPLLSQTAPISSAYSLAREETLKGIREKGLQEKVIRANIGFIFNNAADRLLSLSKQAFRRGLGETGHQIWEIEPYRTDGKIQDHINKYVKKLEKVLLEAINRHSINDINLKGQDAAFIGLIFDSLEYRTKQIDNSELLRAYNYGRLIGYQLSDEESVHSEYLADEDCEVCQKASLQTFNSNDIIYEELPPHHPLCSCVIAPTKEKDA